METLWVIIELFLWNLVWCFGHLDLLKNLPGLILTSEHCRKYLKVHHNCVFEGGKYFLIQILWGDMKLYQDLKLPRYIPTPQIIQRSP